MHIDQEAAEVLDLALELFYLGPCETWSDAVNVAASVVSGLRRVAYDWDRAVADAAALAGDAETTYAASPF